MTLLEFMDKHPEGCGAFAFCVLAAITFAWFIHCANDRR